MSLRLRNLNPYDLHKTLINEYILTKKGTSSQFKRDTSRDKRDIDVIRENHKFLWDEGKDAVDSWEKQLAKKYYDKLFKEYCISDLSRYKENKVALRWQTEQELIDGKGQFQCGNKKCIEKEKLQTWEVNFGYIEEGAKKNALVKLRLCPDCSYKLNYRQKRKKVKRLKKSDMIAEPSAVNETITSTEEESEKKPETSEAKAAETSWKEPTSNPTEEKSRDEEFEEYLEQLLL